MAPSPSRIISPAELGLALTLVSALVLARSDVPSPALVRPNFTPIQIANQSSTIYEVSMSAANADQITLTPTQVIKPSDKAPVAMTIDISGLTDVPAVLKSGGVGVLMVGSFEEAGQGKDKNAEATPVIVLCTGPTWYIVRSEAGKYSLEADTYDLNGAWAGGADMLARCFAYIVKTKERAEVPVTEGIIWKGEKLFGKVPSTPTASLTATLPGVGPCVILGGEKPSVISPAGITPFAGPALAIGTADLKGDGAVQILRWDGTTIRAGAIDTAGEVIGTATGVRNLSAIAAGSRSVVVAFTATGAVRYDPTGAVSSPFPGPLPAEAGGGYAGAIADLDNDGIADVVQSCAGGIVIWKGLGNGGVANPALTWKGTLAEVATVMVSDIDADGKLDLVLSGKGKATPLLINAGGFTWANRLSDTGELEYHGAESGARAGMAWDANQDGRIDVLLFPDGEGPKSYFNRGFACFGFSRDIQVSQNQNGGNTAKAFAAIQEGTMGGGSIDVNGDGQADVVAIAKDGSAWALLAQPAVMGAAVPEGLGRMTLTVNMAKGSPDAVTISARDSYRSLGARVSRPGQPAEFGVTARGPVTLTWTSADGKNQSRVVRMQRTMTETLAAP